MQKKKKIIKNKTRSNRKNRKSVAVSSVCPKYPLFRHFKLLDSKHTGKLIHYSQTSHLLLVLIVLVFGAIIFCFDRLATEDTNVLGSHTVSVTAIVPAPKTISETVASSSESVSTTSTQANGPGHSNTPIDVEVTEESTSPVSNNVHSEWFDISVPLYSLLLAVTLGFWIGDLFDRYFGISKLRRNRRNSA